MKLNRVAFAAGAAALSLLLASCSGSSDGGKVSSDDDKSFVYITSDPIGQNEFLKSGKVGIEKIAEEQGGDAKTYESKDDETRRANLEQAVAEQPEVIVMLGFQFQDMAKEFAEQYPDQPFLLIDAEAEGAPDNLYEATFREYEPSYLLGVEAGMLTKSNKVGSVLSLDIPLLHKYSGGFAEGAESVNDAVKAVKPQIIGGDNPFADTARAKEQSLAFASGGADQVFAVGAAANGGIMDAAKEKDFFTYGVDANQCDMAPRHVVDGTVKAVNVVVETVVGEILDGKTRSEATSSFGLKEGGMTIVSLDDGAEDSGCVVMDHDDVLKKVTKTADDIKDGKLKVKDPSK
jgi:basic membrane protein A